MYKNKIIFKIKKKKKKKEVYLQVEEVVKIIKVQIILKNVLLKMREMQAYLKRKSRMKILYSKNLKN